MNHDHVLFLDERHSELLTPIVALWFAWTIAAAVAQRRWGTGWLVVLASVAGVLIMASDGLGLYAAQWLMFALLGAWLGRR